jgi:hypothetical protein
MAVLGMLDGLRGSFGALQGFPWWLVGVRDEAGAVACLRAAHQGFSPSSSRAIVSLALLRIPCTFHRSLTAITL